MATVNTLTNGEEAIPIADDPIMIWPVEETGRNSVIPSIMARTSACK
jgi:hypothetical protein